MGQSGCVHTSSRSGNRRLTCPWFTWLHGRNPQMPLSTTPLERYLAEQADLAPVERLSLCEVPDTGIWQDRIPLTAPLRGQQYAFDVNLDTCTGCKACVT